MKIEEIEYNHIIENSVGHDFKFNPETMQFLKIVSNYKRLKRILKNGKC